ncbi:saccharopine dehydrogenase [Halteromyces radiatus]|uniref:saccharopine dehydrogenase n=1 Tax=Halteromyces radiatus TaxID=101107 RepID=UPI00221EC4BE|nr:saccharopine dehydrogenase [Halteromyces radiatus]KAI8096624.1 saccharopine dehydrogenase [Halteromyces radiatus]
MMTSRKYDLVVYGATGFTGELTCEYIIEQKYKDLKWAIAGRSLAKLEKTKQNLIKLDESIKDIDLIIADASNPESLDAFLAQTKVVLSTVGPFIKYGTPLVEACLRQKTHYVDITGEYNWIKSVIEKYHEKAQQENILIIPACGFDSVPSDLGTFMVVDYLARQHQLHTAEVKTSLVKVKGRPSGGTIQTLIESLSDKSLSSTENLDPYLLSPHKGQDKPYIPWMYKDYDFGGKWQAFFIMSVINEKIVRRSWSLYTDRPGQSYGKLFKYRESMTLPFLPAFLLTSVLLTMMPIATILLKFAPFRRFAQNILPAGGTGPNREERAKGHFQFELIGTGETEPYDPPVRVRGVVKGFSDPGYGDTCRMVAESALSIVYSLDSLPGKQGGVLTPATGLGKVLIDRLTTNGGMVFEVNDIPT